MYSNEAEIEGQGVGTVTAGDVGCSHIIGCFRACELMREHFSFKILTLKMRIRMTLNIQKTEVTSGIFGVRGWDEPSAQQGLTSVQSTKVYKYVQSIYKAYKLYTIHVPNISYKMVSINQQMQYMQYG